MHQGLANLAQQPVFINKVLLEHSHTHSLCIVHGCFCANNGPAEYLQQRVYSLQSQKMLLSGLYRKSLRTPALVGGWKGQRQASCCTNFLLGPVSTSALCTSLYTA